VIRQAISCDICASEKRQTNHWFVAYEKAGELRVSGWNSRHRLRPGSKHLCGQTCLHKLVDEFIAKSIAVRAQRGAVEADAEAQAFGDASLISRVAQAEPGSQLTGLRQCGGEPGSSRTTFGPLGSERESSARLFTPSAGNLPRPMPGPQTEIVQMPPRLHPVECAPMNSEIQRHASRAWHAQAWERERERELRAIENHPEIAARRRSSA